MILAIDLGGTRAKLGLVENGQVVDSWVREVEPSRGLLSHLDLFTTQERVSGVSLAFPGLVDPVKLKVLSTPKDKFEDAPGVDLAAWARESMDAPLVLENDARMALLGECGDLRNVVMMTLGTGVGTAALMEGRLVRGCHYQAGILGGHFVMNPQGQTCICGSVGCVESEASTWVVNQRLGTEGGIRELVLRAQNGNAEAQKLWSHCLRVWGLAAVNLVHAYDPEVILLGGAVTQAPQLLPTITKIVQELAWTPWGLPQARLATNGDHAALLGGERLFIQRNHL